jgi:hypothetical protein
MNETERDRLMEFLHQLKQTRFAQYDKVAQDLLADGVGTQPRAAYLLVHRCLVLQAQRDQALQALAASGTPPGAPGTVVWGQDAAGWGVNAQGTLAQEASNADHATAYLLRDAGTEQRAPYRGFEDKAVLFLGNNAGKVWLGIAILAVLVVRYIK